MKISSLQELVNWLIDLDPSGSTCWPCMLPHFESYLFDGHEEEKVKAIKKIQKLSLGKEEPEHTFLRLLNQFILFDLKIDLDKFVNGSPLTVGKDKTLGFSWKAFTHWIIGQLEKVTGVETSLPPHFREAVDEYNKSP